MRRRLRLTDRNRPLVVRRGRKTHRCATRTIDGVECRGWDHGLVPPSHTPAIPVGAEHVENLETAPGFQSGPLR